MQTGDGLQPVHITGRKSRRGGVSVRASGSLQAGRGWRCVRAPGRSADGVRAAGQAPPGRREPDGWARSGWRVRQADLPADLVHCLHDRVRLIQREQRLSSSPARSSGPPRRPRRAARALHTVVRSAPVRRRHARSRGTRSACRTSRRSLSSPRCRIWRGVARCGQQGRGQHRVGAAAVLEDHRRRGVNAGKRRIADRCDPRRRAKHQARERDGVDAKVQQGPAAQFRREQPEPPDPGRTTARARRSGIRHRRAFFGEDLTHPRNVRQEARPHRFHEERSRPRAASIISRAWAASMANGFSTSTALPALIASSAASRWPG